jgi:hypothetical protein
VRKLPEGVNVWPFNFGYWPQLIFRGRVWFCSLGAKSASRWEGRAWRGKDVAGSSGAVGLV